MKTQNKTFDKDLPPSLAKGVRETIEAKTGALNFEAWGETWAAMLEKTIRVLELVARATRRRARWEKDEDTVLVRQAFERVLQISPFNSEDYNVTTVLVFRQKCQALKIGFEVAPTLDGLEQLLRHFESKLPKTLSKSKDYVPE